MLLESKNRLKGGDGEYSDTYCLKSHIEEF
jgi:hypothetical protein